MDTPTDEPDYLVRAVVRAAGILELIRQSNDDVTLVSLSERSGLSKPTVFRLIRTLIHTGLVEQVPHRSSYRLGVQCVVLGQSYLENVDILRESRSILTSLRDATTETVHLGVLDGDSRVVYLEKLEGNHAVGVMKSRVGRAVPSYCTGIGKLLLAYGAGPVPLPTEDGGYERFTEVTITDPEALRAELALVRERGYSMDLGEHEHGVQCVATPIRDSTGAVIAGLSVTGPIDRMPVSRLQDEILDQALTASAEISARLGWAAVGATPLGHLA